MAFAPVRFRAASPLLFSPFMRVLIGLAIALAASASAAMAQLSYEPLAATAEPKLRLAPMRNWLRSHEERSDAQETPIQTDRPSFTASHLVIPKGFAQLESGYQFTYKQSDTRIQNSYSAPQFNLRIGLADWVESRTLWNGVETTGERDIITGHRELFTTTAHMQTGFKFKITEEQGLIPQSALITAIFLPTAPSKGTHDQVAPNVDYIYFWTLSDKLTLTGSTGAVFGDHGNRTHNEYFQSLVLGQEWTEKLSTYWEWYVTGNDSYFRQAAGHNMDGGVLWRPWKNIQFDWRAGFPVGSADDSFFTGVGFSARY